MAEALADHYRIIAEVVAAFRGRLLKTKGEGDGTVSVFARATDGVPLSPCNKRFEIR